MIKKMTAAVLLSAAAMAVTAPVFAEEASSPLTASANINLVSDYRFRGVSLNLEKFAVQGGVDLSYAVSDNFSIYVGNWNSTLETATGFGNPEVDLYGGMTGKVENFGWKLGVVGYLYPDASNVNYYEVQGEVSTTVGPVSAAFGTYIAPKQKNFGDKTGVYLYTNLSAAIPDTGFTVKGGLGYEDNAYFSNKIDWNLGVSYTYKVFTAGVSYIDTNRASPYGVGKDAADATVVGTIGILLPF